MPLTRLKEEYLEQDGVRFLMADEDGSTVACRVSHEALRDHADRMHLSGADSVVLRPIANWLNRWRVTLTTPKVRSIWTAEFSSLPRRSRE